MSKNEINNRTLYFGDNLDILREKIPDESVDLIYLDPPFNSGKDYNACFKSKTQYDAFEDTWEWDNKKEEEFNNLIKTKNSNISDLTISLRRLLKNNKGEDSGTTAYIITMTSRLIELHRVLKPTGSIYLHCDPTASHYLKIVMDTIFGEENFRNEIVWCYRKWTNNTNSFQSNHDIILFYTKSNKYTFNKLYDPNAIAKHYEKGYHTNTVHENGKQISQLIVYDKEKSKHLINKYDKVIYREGVNEVVMPDWWEISIINSQSKERLGYPTQKPEKLLERIILASSNKGDVILDPFCGCGTTIAVAEKEERQWIGIDIAPIAITVIKKRMLDYCKDDKEFKINLDGLPKDLDGAIMLAEQCGVNGRFDFQFWVLSLLGALPASNKSKDRKKGADSGIDGIIRYSDIIENDFKLKTEYKDIIVSVKSGKHPDVTEIRDLKGVIDREKASGGIYVTLYEPTKPMRKEEAQAGTFKYQNTNIPKLQICIVEDLLNGKMPIIPQSHQKEIFKKAEKKEVIRGKQRSLYEDIGGSSE